MLMLRRSTCFEKVLFCRHLYSKQFLHQKNSLLGKVTTPKNFLFSRRGCSIYKCFAMKNSYSEKLSALKK